MFIRETTPTRLFIRVFSEPFCISMASSYPMTAVKSSKGLLEKGASWVRRFGLRPETQDSCVPVYRFESANGLRLTLSRDAT